MYRIERINNLTNKNSEFNYSELANEIASLVLNNIEYSNDGAYDDASMERLCRNKTAESTLEMINDSYVICVFDDQKLIACGFAKMQDGRYFSKSLHVHQDYRGKGLAQFICNEREDFLRSIGVKELFIESLKFEHTMKFHERRGFTYIPPYKELRNTVLMMKIL